MQIAINKSFDAFNALAYLNFEFLFFISLNHENHRANRQNHKKTRISNISNCFKNSIA